MDALKLQLGNKSGLLEAKRQAKNRNDIPGRQGTLFVEAKKVRSGRGDPKAPTPPKYDPPLPDSYRFCSREVRTSWCRFLFFDPGGKNNMSFCLGPPVERKE